METCTEPHMHRPVIGMKSSVMSASFRSARGRILTAPASSSVQLGFRRRARRRALSQAAPRAVTTGEPAIEVHLFLRNAEFAQRLALGGEILFVGRAAGVAQERAGRRSRRATAGLRCAMLASSHSLGLFAQPGVTAKVNGPVM